MVRGPRFVRLVRRVAGESRHREGYRGPGVRFNLPDDDGTHFLNLIVEHLTEHGAMEAGLLHESPFTDLNPQGPEGIFTSTQVDELVALLTQIGARAVA